MNKTMFTLFYLVLAEAFYRLKLDESWRGSQKRQEGFSKEDKESLNAQFYLILKPLFEKEYGITVSDETMAKRVVARILRKAFLWDYKPQNIKLLKEKTVGFDKKAIDYVKECVSDLVHNYYSSYNYAVIESAVISEKDIEQFVDWIFSDIMPYDKEDIVYEAAKHLATRIEFEEVQSNLRPDMVEEIRQDLDLKLETFKEYPIVYNIAYGVGEYAKTKELFKAISWSRYTFRWQSYYTPVRCSILTHMLETAVLAYMMAYEMSLCATNEADRLYWSQLTGKAYKVGLFHDINEIWTDDIPSPAKDGLDIRKIVEEQELATTNEKIYKRLPECVVQEFQSGVMLEDVANTEEKSFYKSADYFSADLEVWWNIRAGARDYRFKKILHSSLKAKRTNGARTAIRYFIAEIAGEKFFR